MSKANLESEAGDEEKAKAIRNIIKAERCNQCYCNFKFHQGTGILTQEINPIQIPKLWKTMAEYEEDDEFDWIDPKKVDKNDESKWRIITVPAEIEFFLLKTNQLYFGQPEHEGTPFFYYRTDEEEV